MKKLLLLFLPFFFLISYTVEAQVSADNNGTASPRPTGAVSSFTINNFNVPAGNNVALIVASRMPTREITSIQFNGMTYSSENVGVGFNGANRGEIWAIPLGNISTPLSNQTITINLDASIGLYAAFAATFTNVDQITPANNFTSEADGDLSIDVPSSSGDMAVDLISGSLTPNFSAGTGQTALVNNVTLLQIGDVQRLSGSFEASSGSTVNMSWSNSGGTSLLLHVGANIQANGALPVELTSFKAIQSKENIDLLWETATEINNDKFEVEQSRDGRAFQKIGEVKGKGTTLAPQEYAFEVTKPRNGISYYRLKQIDFDRQFDYSKVVSVNFIGNGDNIGGFYPNPSHSGFVHLEYFAEHEDEVPFSVFDITGKLVISQVQQLSRGANNLSFDFGDLDTGIYIVKIGGEGNPTHRKLIIER